MSEPAFLIVSAAHPSLSADHLDELADELRRESRYFGRRAASGPKPSPALVRRLVETRGDHDETVVAYADGELIGLARLTPSNHGHEMWIAVVERWRRRGVGGCLAEAAVLRARSLGFERVVWHSSQRSAAALSVGRRIGFEVVDMGRGRVDLVADHSLRDTA